MKIRFVHSPLPVVGDDELVVETAVTLGVENGSKLRLDTTVMETETGRTGDEICRG